MVARSRERGAPGDALWVAMQSRAPVRLAERRVMAGSAPRAALMATALMHIVGKRAFF